MLETFLVPEITVESDGESAAIPLGDSAGKAYLITLAITKIVEQESLEISIWGSADGSDWGSAPLITFPQKFYQGIYQFFLDLSERAEVQHLKAKWALNRWGVGDPKPRFSFLLKIQETAPVGSGG